MSNAATINSLRPGHLLNFYPEAKVERPSTIERRAKELGCSRRAKKLSRRSHRIGKKIFNLATSYHSQDAVQIIEQVEAAKQALNEEGWTDKNLQRMLALVGVRVKHIYGFDLHAEQYFGAWVLLQGMLAEMSTGEGKTIMAGVAAVVAALSGAPVHIITSNDYLVERDANTLSQLFDAFDLSSGFVIQDKDDDQRRQAYACDICYVTNKIVVFDYLRDRQAFGQHPSMLNVRIRGLTKPGAGSPLLRGLCFAIVDEADSALIDDAITPLILSRLGDAGNGMAQSLAALSLAQRLEEDLHFRIDNDLRRVRLTTMGTDQLKKLAHGLHGAWSNQRFRDELACQALACMHVYKRDVDYIVRDGEIVLIDQSTGRMMPDRKLQNGLHQMIETKENCELSGKTFTMASLSFQNFFVRYKHLCGMTGTAREASVELRQTYRLGVVRVPTHHSSRRQFAGATFAKTREHYRALIVGAIQLRLESGQPVLVGTRSLEHSEEISRRLTAEGLQHRLLNARQDQEEAEIVAQAGQDAVITIATNMAGRGTDIPISDTVRNKGGLHVIVSQLNESRRIDRQLIGRCSRQGDPGSYEYIVAPDDLVWSQQRGSAEPLSGFTSMLAGTKRGNNRLFRRATNTQKNIERSQRRLRKQVASDDRQMRKNLAFTGYKE